MARSATATRKTSQPKPITLIESVEPTDALAVGLFESKEKTLPEALQFLPPPERDALSQALALGDFKPRPGNAQVIPLPKNANARRLILVGLGKAESFDLDTLRWAAATVARTARSLKLATTALAIHPLLSPGTEPADAAQAIAEGLVLASFTYDEFKKPKSENAPGSPNYTVLEPDRSQSQNMQSTLDTGSAIAAASNYARTLASKPGNVINPATLVEEARDLAGRLKLRITVIDARRAEQLGMGGLVGVGQGSVEPAALIILEYRPAKTPKNARPVAVVGKAVTFDTGGISIKPAADMDAMKYDKSGGMAVLGVMHAVASLDLPTPVVGVIPTAENSVSSRAYRPGDILTMYNNKTVEITNTDAEGRLILADALAYACEQYKPAAVIDLATLTGGVVVALGSVYAGLFSNNDNLAGDLIAAGNATGELLWRLPLHERYKPLMDGTHADLQNSGGREAHPTQGAIFLQHFVPPETPWAHLDIAGTAHPKKDDRYTAKGASGFGVRLLVEYLRRQAR